MRKKSAFTLIELLTALTVLGLLLIISIPHVIKYINKGSESYYHSVEKNMKVAGMNYLQTYRSLLPREIGNTVEITLEELMDNNYIETVKDSDGNVCTGRVAVVKRKRDSFSYYSCLICGDSYISNEVDCSYSEEDNVYLDKEDYSIEIEDTTVRKKANAKYSTPHARVYYKGELIKDDLLGRPIKVDTSIVGTHEVSYYYHGVTKKINVEVVESTNPRLSELSLNIGSSKGTEYEHEWTNQNVYATYDSDDEIDYYETSEDGKNFTRITGKTETISKEGSYKRYVRAVNVDGYKSDIYAYDIKIDKTKPTCSLEVKSGNAYVNSSGTTWYNNEITVGYKTADGTQSDVKTKKVSYTIDGTTTTSSNQASINADVSNLTVTGSITDAAGNTNTCTTKVNIDTKNPTVTVESENVVEYQLNKSIADYFTVTNTTSGVDKVECKLMNSAGTQATSTSVSNINELQLGKNYVECTITTGAGKTKTAKTQFKHWYYATVNCSNGTYASGSDCKKDYSDEANCGCQTYINQVSENCTCKTTGKIWTQTKSECSSRSKNSTTSTKRVTCTKTNGKGTCKSYKYECITETSSTGCTVYNSCRHENHGCEVANTCSKVENTNRSYSCDQTGNSTVTLKSNKCSF